MSGGSSKSSSSNTSSQSYSDQRQAVQGGQAINGLGNSTSSTSSDNHSTSVSNAGNTNTSSSLVYNYTGTDGDTAARIATTFADLGVAQSEHDAASFHDLLMAGSHLTDLASVTQANAMAASTHMLDLTGELIDKLATGTSNAVATQGAIITAGMQQAASETAQKTALSGIDTKTLLIIGAGLAVLMIVMKR